MLRHVTLNASDTNNIEEKDTLKTVVKDTVKIEEDKLNSKTKDKTHVSDCLFEEFWKAYPKKVSKAQASKAFRKLNPDQALLDAMLT